MAQTNIRGAQIQNGTVQRADLNTTTVGQAVITKVIQGTNVSLSSTGSDSGTGDVTISAPTTVSTDAGNQATIGSDSRIYVPSIPLASSTASGLLKQLSGNTTDFVDGTNAMQPLAPAVQPTIWSARLRSFNALGNPNFEVDQRNVGNVVANPAAGTFIMDRWFKAGAGTYQVSCQQAASSVADLVPGTNFRLSAKYFAVTLTTAQATLGAGDFLAIRQLPEGIALRELIGDVHSLQVMVASTVTPLKFSVFLRDSAVTPTRSLVKLCTYTAAAGVWQLIQLPNLPVWDSGGTFNITPGLQGYDVGAVLACGSTMIAPAADTWQSGNFVGAPGMDNFVSKAVNSNFIIGFVQHEPGPLCTTLIDKPFAQNYDECLRYYCKSYDYDVASGTANAVGAAGQWQQSTVLTVGSVRFPKPMAKIPTLTAYNPVTGTANSARLLGGADYAVSSFNGLGKGGFLSMNMATMPAVAAGAGVQIHYAADAGW